MMNDCIIKCVLYIRGFFSRFKPLRPLVNCEDQQNVKISCSDNKLDSARKNGKERDTTFKYSKSNDVKEFVNFF